MKGKEWGAIYLILGTCVAAGMLGLPVVTAAYSMPVTIAMLFSAWFIMTWGAWCLMRVNLRFPTGSNLLTMAEGTLGKFWRKVTWFFYLLLLYSLICSYLAGSGDVIDAGLARINLFLPRPFATTLATVLLGAIVYKGMHAVDWANRFLMSLKLIMCLF